MITGFVLGKTVVINQIGKSYKQNQLGVAKVRSGFINFEKFVRYPERSAL